MLRSRHGLPPHHPLQSTTYVIHYSKTYHNPYTLPHPTTHCTQLPSASHHPIYSTTYHYPNIFTLHHLPSSPTLCHHPYNQPPTTTYHPLHSTIHHHPLHSSTTPTLLSPPTTSNHLPPLHFATIPSPLHSTIAHHLLHSTTIHNPINSTNCHNSLHFGTTPTLNQLPQSTTLKHLPPLPSSSTTIHCTQPLATPPTLCHHLHSTTYHHPLHSTTSPPSFSLHHLPLIIHNTKPYTTIPYTIYRPPLSHHLYTQPFTTIPNSQPLAIIPPSPHSATYYYPTMAQMVRAFGMNLKVGGSSPPQVETLSVSKTLILSREHPFMCRKLMLLPTHS